MKEIDKKSGVTFNIIHQDPRESRNHLQFQQQLVSRKNHSDNSTGSSTSINSTEHDSNATRTIKSILQSMIFNTIKSISPEQLDNLTFSIPRRTLTSPSSLSLLFNSRTNRVLTKVISNFEDFVNESYLGKSNISLYSGKDAYLAKSLVENTLKQLWPFCHVEAYGSISTGLWLPGQSDVDLLIDFNKYHLTDSSMLKYFPPLSPPFISFFNYSPFSHSHPHSNHPHSMPRTHSHGRPTPQDTRTSNNSVMLQNAYYTAWTQVINKLYLQNNDIQQGFYDRDELLIILEESVKIFNTINWYKEVKLIKSLMPVVKLTVLCNSSHGHGQSVTELKEIPVDVSILNQNHVGLQTRDFICKVMSKSPGIFRPLVLILKQVLREKKLHDVYTGGLGSYALSLMVIFFLIRCGFNLVPSNVNISSQDTSQESENDEQDETMKKEIKEKERLKADIPAPAFHLPPNPLPNHFQTAKNEILIDDKGIAPLLSSNFEEKYKNYSSDLQNMLKTSCEKVNSITSSIRSHLLNTSTIRRSPELLGCLLLGFLKLFSLPEDGGLNLSFIGFNFEVKGRLFIEEVPHSGILFNCPINKVNKVGIGSYNILQVQHLFSVLYKTISKEPQKLLFFLKVKQFRSQPQPQQEPNEDINKPLSEQQQQQQHQQRLPPPRHPPEYQMNLKPYHEPQSTLKIIEKEADQKNLEKKEIFKLDIKEMDRKLAAVQESRYKRRLKANNLARFQSESIERKKCLAEKFSLKLGFTKTSQAQRIIDRNQIRKEFDKAFPKPVQEQEQEEEEELVVKADDEDKVVEIGQQVKVVEEIEQEEGDDEDVVQDLHSEEGTHEVEKILSGDDELIVEADVDIEKEDIEEELGVVVESNVPLPAQENRENEATISSESLNVDVNDRSLPNIEVDAEKSTVRKQSWATIVKSPTSPQIQSSAATSVSPSSATSPLLKGMTQPSTKTTYLQNSSPQMSMMINAAPYHGYKPQQQQKKMSFGQHNYSRGMKNRQEKLKQKPSAVLFVGNLSYTASVDDLEVLKRLFEEHGEIIDSTLDKKHGMVWFKFRDKSIATHVLKNMDQKIFLNRPMYVDFSQMPSDDYDHTSSAFFKSRYRR